MRPSSPPPRTSSRRIITAVAAVLQLVWVGDAFCLPASSSAAMRGTSTARRHCNGASQAAQRDPRRRVHKGSAYPLWHNGFSSYSEAAPHTAVGGSAIRNRHAGIGSSAFTASSSGRSRRAAQGTGSGALTMSVDELSVLGKDALMFLAATVVVVPACKKANIR